MLQDPIGTLEEAKHRHSRDIARSAKTRALAPMRSRAAWRTTLSTMLHRLAERLDAQPPDAPDSQAVPEGIGGTT